MKDLCKTLSNSKEEYLLLSNILSKYLIFENKKYIQYTKFLSVSEKTLVNTFLEKAKINDFSFISICSFSERCILVFHNNDFNESKFLKENFALIKIEYIKNKLDNIALTHRDFLGGILSLGINRDVVGDIFVYENYALILVTSEMSSFILDNLNKIGRKNVSLSISSFESIKDTISKKEEVIKPMSSLRIDNFISSAFNISRQNATLAIEKGNIYINSFLASSKTKLIKPLDIITFRGKGKIKILEILGQSKKGKIKVLYEKY